MKPIIFSAEMVRAILGGRKTMTRRVIKFPPSFSHADFNIYGYEGPVNGKHLFTWGRNINGAFFDGAIGVNQPYKDGDVMWVRETWQYVDVGSDDSGYVFKASENGQDWADNSEAWKWKPSIFMPREAARLFLRVTAVRAERLQDISTSDCEREGLVSDIDRFGGMMTPHHDWIVGEFAKLWDSLNAKRGYGWDVNDWVWVNTLERISKEEVDNV